MVVFGFILIALLVVYFFPGKPEKDAKRAASLVLQEHVKNLQGDADNDGLKDWEESIFRTDKSNADTDGDGTKDGDEIAQGRDPTVHGPKDTIIPAKAPAIENIGPENITRDFTENFLREPIGQILAGQSAAVNPEYVEAYTDRLLRRSLLAEAPKIVLADIHVIQKPTEKDIILYFQSFEKIFKELEAREESEIDVVVRAFKDQNYEQLKKIDKRIGMYSTALEKLRFFPTPLVAAEFQVKVINYLHKFALATEIMRNAEIDPIQAMLVINEVTKLREEFGIYLMDAEKTLLASLSK